MSMWWDENKQKYKTSLIYKIFYQWIWPVTRFFLFKINPETAHHFGIISISIIYKIEQIYQYLIAIPLILILILIRLISFLPGFTWKIPDSEILDSEKKS